MTWLTWLYVGAIVVTGLVVWCGLPTGQAREDKRVTRLLRGKR